MRRRFSHLTWKNRLKIETMLKERRTVREIADALHVHNSTIYREIQRGKTIQRTTELVDVEVYCADMAEQKYREHLREKGPCLKIGNDHAMAAYIEDKIINDHYSPAAALAKIKEEGRIFSTEISKWTLYSYITKGLFLHLTNQDLPMRGRRKTKYRKVRELRLPKGESIEMRPSAVNRREVFGHWEMDTVVSSRRSKKRLLVLTERMTNYEIMELMPDGTSRSVISVLNKIERKLGSGMFRSVFQSITTDNGSEFADCKGMENSCLRKGQRTHIYTCHPYSAYERGSNENANRMIRRHLPKGTNFAKLSNKSVKAIENWLNTYPRERLGWRNAESVFRDQVEAIAG